MSEMPSSCVLVGDAAKRKGSVIPWRRKIQHGFWSHLLSGGAGIAAISADMPRSHYGEMLNSWICRIPLNKSAFRVVYKRSAYQDTRRESNAVPRRQKIQQSIWWCSLSGLSVLWSISTDKSWSRWRTKCYLAYLKASDRPAKGDTRQCPPVCNSECGTDRWAWLYLQACFSAVYQWLSWKCDVPWWACKWTGPSSSKSSRIGHKQSHAHPPYPRCFYSKAWS